MRSTSFGNQKVLFYLFRKLIFFKTVLIYFHKRNKGTFKSMLSMRNIILRLFKKNMKTTKKSKRELISFLRKEFKSGNSKRKELIKTMLKFHKNV
jgi:hypothetical protein